VDGDAGGGGGKLNRRMDGMIDIYEQKQQGGLSSARGGG